MTDLSPDQIQQAREIAQTVISYPYRVLTAEGTTLARAVLALTEQQPTPVHVDPHADDWCEHDEIESRCRLPHAEQQPEPVAPPLNEDPVAVALGLIEPLNKDIAARAEAVKVRVAVLRLWRELFEPVSRDEIVDMFEAEFADAPTYAVVEQLLSRYTITRKQPEGADHG